jgi:hypothetical protein
MENGRVVEAPADRDQLQAVRSGPWKLFVPLAEPRRHPHYSGPGPSPAMLFNVVEDVGCREDVAAGHPEIVARLTQWAEAARADLGDAGRAGTGRRPVGQVNDPTLRVKASLQVPDPLPPKSE